MDADRMRFRETMILPEDGTPFCQRMEAWQREDFAALDSGQYHHAYLERLRGHSKTGDLGTEPVTELILGRPGQGLFCATADEGQASLLFEDVRGKFERNPSLRSLVKVMQREIIVRATGSRLKVLASDALSAYGLHPDWLAIFRLCEAARMPLGGRRWGVALIRASRQHLRRCTRGRRAALSGVGHRDQPGCDCLGRRQAGRPPGRRGDLRQFVPTKRNRVDVSEV